VDDKPPPNREGRYRRTERGRSSGRLRAIRSASPPGRRIRSHIRWWIRFPPSRYPAIPQRLRRDGPRALDLETRDPKPLLEALDGVLQRDPSPVEENDLVADLRDLGHEVGPHRHEPVLFLPSTEEVPGHHLPPGSSPLVGLSRRRIGRSTRRAPAGTIRALVLERSAKSFGEGPGGPLRSPPGFDPRAPVDPGAGTFRASLAPRVRSVPGKVLETPSSP
jgi:hypothetical protein